MTHVVQCYGHAEQQVVTMELDRREAEAKEAEKRLQKLGAKPWHPKPPPGVDLMSNTWCACTVSSLVQLASSSWRLFDQQEKAHLGNSPRHSRPRCSGRAGTAGFKQQFSTSIQQPQSEYNGFWLMLEPVNTWADWTSRYRTHKWQQVYINKAAASRPLCVGWQYTKPLLHCCVGIDFGHPACPLSFADCFELLETYEWNTSTFLTIPVLCPCWWRLVVAIKDFLGYML